MDPKGVVFSLVGLGAAFFYLSGNKTMEVSGLDRLLGGGVMTSDGGGGMISMAEYESRLFAAGGTPVSIALAVDGFSAASVIGMPAGIVTRPDEAGCNVTRPTAEHSVVTAFFTAAGMESSIYSYAQENFAHAAVYYLEHFFRDADRNGANRDDLALKPLGQMGMRIVNVVLPPSDKPVYLVLIDRGDRNVYNFLPMQGAKLAHVTLLSNNPGGLVNLPDGVTLSVPDIRSGACGAFDRTIEVPEHTVENGFQPSDETLVQWGPYAVWFKDTFGRAPIEGLITVMDGSGVYAGAAPAEGAVRATWRGVEGATVTLWPDEVQYAAGPKEHAEWFQKKAAEEIALAFGAAPGADTLALVKPALVERTTP
jgi:hypothetical protein